MSLHGSPGKCYFWGAGWPQTFTCATWNKLKTELSMWKANSALKAEVGDVAEPYRELLKGLLAKVEATRDWARVSSWTAATTTAGRLLKPATNFMRRCWPATALYAMWVWNDRQWRLARYAAPCRRVWSHTDQAGFTSRSQPPRPSDRKAHQHIRPGTLPGVERSSAPGIPAGRAGV